MTLIPFATHRTDPPVDTCKGECGGVFTCVTCKKIFGVCMDDDKDQPQVCDTCWVDHPVRIYMENKDE